MTPLRIANTESFWRDWLGYAVNIIIMIFASLFGGWHILFRVLITFIALDFTTAFIRIYFNQTKFCSEKAIKGIFKKLLYFVAIAFSNQVDIFLIAIDIEIPTNASVRMVVLIMFCAIEATSVLRNLNSCGIQFPAWLAKILSGLVAPKISDNEMTELEFYRSKKTNKEE